jgi:hypothetical protein
MTVKQFGFVAAGIILAVIMWYFPNKAFGLLAIPIKMILIPLFGVSGIIISFVPIEGRPADVMASNFVKALFAPNQFVYKREGRQFSFSKVAAVTPAAQAAAVAAQKAAEAQKLKAIDTKGAKLQAFLYASSQGQTTNALDKKEMDFFKNISSLSAATTPHPTAQTAPAVQSAPTIPTPIPPASAGQQITATMIPPTPTTTPTTPSAVLSPAPTPAPQPAPRETPEELGKEEAVLQEQLTVAKQEETSAPATDSSSVHQKVLELEKKMQEIHQQKLQIEQELMKAKTEASTPQSPTAQPGVRVVSQQAQRSAGLPHIPDTPNVVVGIVKDPRGNVLNNILVEIKDKDNNPVRAFKTNALGQFASATQLATGIYTIELEDPKKQNRFDVIQLVANNQILLPLEIVSHDAREELRKELFN